MGCFDVLFDVGGEVDDAVRNHRKFTEVQCVLLMVMFEWKTLSNMVNKLV